jgi:signal transduction histidine kinase
MSRERWIALAVGVITVVVTLLLLALLDQREASSKVPFDCVDPTERERVRQLVFDGVDKGLVEAMSHLFEIWQRDPNNAQPTRAQVGTTNAVNAHNRARKLAFAWDPPPCSSESKPKEN